MAKLIGDQMMDLFIHLVLPFQWGLGGACAEPATRLGTVSPLVGRIATDQRINSPADGDFIPKSFVNTLNIILPKSLVTPPSLAVRWSEGYVANHYPIFCN
jgi:hypothetical protein